MTLDSYTLGMASNSEFELPSVYPSPADKHTLLVHCVNYTQHCTHIYTHIYIYHSLSLPQDCETLSSHQVVYQPVE